MIKKLIWTKFTNIQGQNRFYFYVFITLKYMPTFRMTRHRWQDFKVLPEVN